MRDFLQAIRAWLGFSAAPSEPERQPETETDRAKAEARDAMFRASYRVCELKQLRNSAVQVMTVGTGYGGTEMPRIEPFSVASSGFTIRHETDWAPYPDPHERRDLRFWRMVHFDRGEVATAIAEAKAHEAETKAAWAALNGEEP